MGLFRCAILAAGLTLPLTGCTYDYLNHEDGVSYGGGNAVAANLAQETINPEQPSMYSTGGLGRNGNVIPKQTTTTQTSATTVNSTSTLTTP
jgi:hypothetical protein